MEKKDIKNGMIIEYRNGETALCIESVFSCKVFVSQKGYINIDEFSEDLSCKLHDFDIVKIRKPSHPSQFAFILHKDATTFWIREEKEMTLAEVSAALGYKVKIVE